MSKAAQVVDDLQGTYELLTDLVDFSVSAQDLLRTFLLKMIDFKVIIRWLSIAMIVAGSWLTLCCS